MKIENLKRILNGDIDLIDHVDVRDIAWSKDHVLITPQHVRKMLIDFLQGKIEPYELTKWTKFICLRAEYDSVHSDIDPLDKRYNEIADYYDTMWSIVSRLSTPEIDGEVNEETVKEYLAELDKYKEDDDRYPFFKN